MNIQDLLGAWDRAVVKATIEQQRVDEMQDLLKTHSGLRVGSSGTPYIR